MNKKYNDSKIIELHSKGLTDREIAEILGVTPSNLATKEDVWDYLQINLKEILIYYQNTKNLS